MLGGFFATRLGRAGVGGVEGEDRGGNGLDQRQHVARGRHKE